jgi:hypothetical protein
MIQALRIPIAHSGPEYHKGCSNSSQKISRFSILSRKCRVPKELGSKNNSKIGHRPASRHEEKVCKVPEILVPTLERGNEDFADLLAARGGCKIPMNFILLGLKRANPHFMAIFLYAATWRFNVRLFFYKNNRDQTPILMGAPGRTSHF